MVGVADWVKFDKAYGNFQKANSKLKPRFLLPEVVLPSFNSMYLYIIH